MMRSTIAILLGLTLLACDTARDSGSEALDSVGSRLEKGAGRVEDKLEEKITGAVSKLKAESREAEVEAVLGRMRGFDSVEVEMTDSVNVTLRGRVASEQDKVRARELVQGIKGIVTVTDSMVVGAGALRNDTTISRDSTKPAR